MAHARPLTSSGDPFVGPLINSPLTVPTVSIVMSTRPEAHLRSGDRRRLARCVGGAERRLARTALPSAARRRLVRRLWDLATEASRNPARQGVALIAGPDVGRSLTLRHPVVDRILIGPAPTGAELAEQTWGFARIAVLCITGRGARLIACDGGSPWEPHPPWDPLDGLPPGAFDVVGQADLLARTAVPERTPLVLAGDDRLVRSFLRLHRSIASPALVLPGDHSETSPAALIAIAKRAQRASLDEQQRAAMVSLVLAVECGTVGPSPRRDAPAPGELLIIERTPQSGTAAAGPAPTDRATRAHGSVVVVPDGFLAHHDRAVVVPDHRLDSTPSPSSPIGGIDPRQHSSERVPSGAGAPC